MNKELSKELSVRYNWYRYFPLCFLVEKIIRRRTEKMFNLFCNFIKKNEKILDIGAGGGWLGKEIKRRKNADVTLLDVFNFNQTDLNLVVYNGKEMPFLNNSFDTVLLIAVLHHTNNPLNVLREARRVAKDKIIIFEDTFNWSLQRFFLYLWDFFSNSPCFLIRPFCKISSFNFKKTEEWENIFRELKLKLIFKRGLKNQLINHTLFVVKKC